MFQRLNAWLVRRSVTPPEGWTDVRERPSSQVDECTVGWFKNADDGFMGAIFHHPGEEMPWAAAAIINGTPILDQHFPSAEVAFVIVEGYAKQWAGLMEQPYIQALRDYDWSSPGPGEIVVEEVIVSDDGNTMWGHGTINPPDDMRQQDEHDERTRGWQS